MPLTKSTLFDNLAGLFLRPINWSAATCLMSAPPHLSEIFNYFISYKMKKKPPMLKRCFQVTLGIVQAGGRRPVNQVLNLEVHHRITTPFCSSLICLLVGVGNIIGLLVTTRKAVSSLPPPLNNLGLHETSSLQRKALGRQESLTVASEPLSPPHPGPN